MLNRDWSSAVTPTILQNTPSRADRDTNRCVFLDPPYLTERRSNTLYGSDLDNSSDAAAVAAYRWAVEHGATYRVAYACHAGDFDVPDGWETVTKKFAGHNVVRKDAAVDMLMFSPACNNTQATLFN